MFERKLLKLVYSAPSSLLALNSFFFVIVLPSFSPFPLFLFLLFPSFASLEFSFVFQSERVFPSVAVRARFETSSVSSWLPAAESRRSVKQKIKPETTLELISPKLCWSNYDLVLKVSWSLLTSFRWRSFQCCLFCQICAFSISTKSFFLFVLWRNERGA